MIVVGYGMAVNRQASWQNKQEHIMTWHITHNDTHTDRYRYSTRVYVCRIKVNFALFHSCVHFEEVDGIVKYRQATIARNRQFKSEWKNEIAKGF